MDDEALGKAVETVTVLCENGTDAKIPHRPRIAGQWAYGRLPRRRHQRCRGASRCRRRHLRGYGGGHRTGIGGHDSSRKKPHGCREEGVITGRTMFGNIIKYIKMTASSNFGNMFSVVGASIFLPFLPMLPLQILVLNLMYDMSQTAIPFDNMDREFIEKPASGMPAVLRGSCYSSFRSVQFLITRHLPFCGLCLARIHSALKTCFNPVGSWKAYFRKRSLSTLSAPNASHFCKAGQRFP